jgi:hypothetical protein
MESKKELNHRLAALAEALILIWWGVVIVVDPVTFGLGLTGTGLILLGLNGIRLLQGMPTKSNTTVLGLIVLVWGVCDHALALDFWSSLAVLLMVIGVVQVGILVVEIKNNGVNVSQ